MSISGMDDLQLRMEKKESVIDTQKKSEIKIHEEKTNGYNEIKTFEKNPSEYMTKPADDIHELKGRFVNCTGTAFDGNYRIIAEKERNPFDVARKKNVKAFEKGKISMNQSKSISASIDKHIKNNHQSLDDIAESNLNAVTTNISDMKDLFGKEIPIPRKNELGDVTVRTKQECRKIIDKDCRNIDKMYDKLIASIDVCLLNENGEMLDNDELKRSLENLKKQCEIEKVQFKDKIYQYADDMINNPRKHKSHATWSDAVEYAREGNKAMGSDKIDYKLVERFNVAPRAARAGAGGGKGAPTPNRAVSNSI